MKTNLSNSIQSGLARLAGLQEISEGNAALLDALRPRFDALRTRHEDGTAPRAVTAFNLFQTPPELAEVAVEMADISEGDRVLEPSAGLGRLILPISRKNPIEIVAIENSPECVRELYQNQAALKIFERDFLEVTPEEIGLFDRIVMNPPFKMRRDIKHIRHAMTFLREGGKLVSFCLAGEIREKAFRDIADDWQEIEAGAFRKEGTGVPTILFSITK